MIIFKLTESMKIQDSGIYPSGSLFFKFPVVVKVLGVNPQSPLISMFCFTLVESRTNSKVSTTVEVMVAVALKVVGGCLFRGVAGWVAIYSGPRNHKSAGKGKTVGVRTCVCVLYREKEKREMCCVHHHPSDNDMRVWEKMKQLEDREITGSWLTGRNGTDVVTPMSKQERFRHFSSLQLE